MEEEEAAAVMKLFKEEKLKVEEKYNVRVSNCAVELAVKSFDFKLISGDATREKVVEILDAACKLVLEKLRNCDHESKFHGRAYELRRALVELIEIKRDDHPDSQSWLTRLKRERDSASIYIGGFLDKWERVLMSSEGYGILSPECAEKLNLIMCIASDITDPDRGMPSRSSSHPDLKRLKREKKLITMHEGVASGLFLDDINDQLSQCSEKLILSADKMLLHEFAAKLDLRVSADPNCSMPSRSSSNPDPERLEREKELITMPKGVARDIGRFLDDTHGQLSQCPEELNLTADKMLPHEFAEKLDLSVDIASRIADPNCSMSNRSSSHPDPRRPKRERELITTSRDIGQIRQFLDDIQAQLSDCFQHILTVKACHVAEVVSKLADVLLTQILPPTDRLKEKSKYTMKQRVVDQDHVIDEIFEIVGFVEPTTTRPRSSFLLLGPPGVGKTEIAKAVAEHWYCDVSRLLKIDMSEYADPQLESASCDLLEWAKEKRQNLWNRLTEAVQRRPYSVILLDKIDKAAASVAEIFLQVLNNKAPSDIKGKVVDFSKSIIFMTSGVGTNQLKLASTCFGENVYARKEFSRDPQEFYETYNCALECLERVVREARKFFSSHLLDSFNKVIVVEKFRNPTAVARLLLREIVREAHGERIIVHASNAALDVLLEEAATKSVGAGTAIKTLLHEHVIPQLSATKGYNSVVVCVDAPFGRTRELLFRLQTDKVSMDDWYFKQKNGTFGRYMANLRVKVESVYNIFYSRRECLPLLACYGQNLSRLRQLLFSICNLILSFSPCPNSPLRSAFKEEALGDKAPDYLLTVEEKEKITNQWIDLQDNIGGLSKATSFVLGAVLKITDAPIGLHDSPARHYLFLGLDDDAKMELIDGLMESLGSSSEKSLFRHVKLDNNCSGEMQRKLLIEEVKEKPCMVFLIDGVEFADDVLYRSLLEIFDDGALSDGEGYPVDFQKTIVILTSAAVSKRAMAKIFNYREPSVLRNMGMDKIVKRFRTELLHRVDEIIYFDPLLPAHGGIIRRCKRDGHYMRQPHEMSVLKKDFRELEMVSCCSVGWKSSSLFMPLNFVPISSSNGVVFSHKQSREFISPRASASSGRYMAVYRGKLAEKYPSLRERSEATDLIVRISLQPCEAFLSDLMGLLFL